MSALAPSPSGTAHGAPLHQVVVMGVSGCGKSTLALALSRELGLDMVDGDDLHLPESVAKMRAGQALEDADRWPWLDRIGHCLARGLAPGSPPEGRVVACSALKRSYRDRIRALAPAVRFVFLDGEADIIRQRMLQRSGHYMQATLLTSQLQTLEKPQPEESDVLALDLSLPVPELVRLASQALHRWPARL